jgi:dimethylglycine dehydrogenase
LQTHAQAVVIGGGIIGCSVAYHLANQGVTEVLLVEKSELTAGSTWHAAGQIAFYADSVLNSRLQKESFEFYTELERAGQPVGQHVCGSLRLALHPEQLREFQSFSARARYLDIDHEIVGAAEARALFPLLYTNEVVGALHIPGDGYVDPNMTTQGIAAQARTHGAVIERFTEVTGLEQLASGEWKVETDRGDIRCETVVNCAGFWAPQLSALLGFELPIVAVEDEYLVTEAIPEVESLDTELPILRDMSTPFYLRQERNGLMVSCYEDEPKFWSLDGIPANFGRELLPVDLERAEDKLQRTMQFVPPCKQRESKPLSTAL